MSATYTPPWLRERPLKPIEPARSAVGGGKSPYRLGRDFEYSVKEQLRRRGYFVMRATGSKGKIDLLAVGEATASRGVSGLFIQCKRLGQIGSAEWNEVFDIASAAHGWPVVCLRPSPRTTAFFRLDARREPRRPGRPWTRFDPTDLAVLLPPPTLLDKPAA